MKYRIEGVWGTGQVKVNGLTLKLGPSQKIYNHSPDGFNWGYGGSGPGQLALAICLAVGMSKEDALGRYQSFKFEHVAQWPQADLDVMLSREEIVGYGEPEAGGVNGK